MTEDQSAKELVFERWRLSERRCYFLMSASGAAIGYALVTVEFDGSLPMAVYFSIALSFWVTSFLSGIYCIRSLQEEVEEIHRNFSIPDLSNPSNWNNANLSPRRAKIRDQIYEKILNAELFQLLTFLIGGMLFTVERLGWIKIVTTEFG